MGSSRPQAVAQVVDISDGIVHVRPLPGRSVKLSVSLPQEDVAVLDEYANTAGLPSRCAALQHAIHLLRHADLEQDYASAWDEWESSGDHALWEAAASAGPGSS